MKQVWKKTLAVLNSGVFVASLAAVVMLLVNAYTGWQMADFLRLHETARPVEAQVTFIGTGEDSKETTAADDYELYVSYPLDGQMRKDVYWKHVKELSDGEKIGAKVTVDVSPLKPDAMLPDLGTGLMCCAVAALGLALVLGLTVNGWAVSCAQKELTAANPPAEGVQPLRLTDVQARLNRERRIYARFLRRGSVAALLAMLVAAAAGLFIGLPFAVQMGVALVAAMLWLWVSHGLKGRTEQAAELRPATRTDVRRDQDDTPVAWVLQGYGLWKLAPERFVSGDEEELHGDRPQTEYILALNARKKLVRIYPAEVFCLEEA